MTVYYERIADFYIMFENEENPTSGPMYHTHSYPVAAQKIDSHGWDALAIRRELVEVANTSPVPPRSMCAVCEIGIYTIDYLCERCRA